MHYPKAKRNLLSLAVASACATLAPAYAQEQTPAQPANDSITQPAIQSVTVTGLRASLATSLNLKRMSDGIVDGIVAEDIGKFPDTNLAESLQRISGVSIDRNIGEGSKVTVRGVGPDFNMVLLNGRQMPTSSLGDLNGRAFDFANLASEAISQLQVYKTSRAETPTGGIGATLNVMTSRPLDIKNTLATVGVKGVYDTSVTHLPGDVKPSGSVTPEVSGIYSTTSADGKFGVALSASYQERHLGYNQAAVPGGWRGPFRGDENNWGTLTGDSTVQNHPKPGDLYEVPQNLNYSMSGVERKRTNAQLTLQWEPVKELRTTLDYTYSENKIATRRADVSAWFNFGKSDSTWTDGPVAAPLVYTEIIEGGNSDVAMGAGLFATKTQNKSLGFNADWKFSPDMRFEFDIHHSTAESKADSPWGSNSTLGSASFSRGTTTADFTHDFPVLSIQGADYAKAPQQVTGSTFQKGYMRGVVDQAQVKGRLNVGEASNLKFGLGLTDVSNRSAFSNVQRDDTWGGATKPSDYPSSLWHAETLRQYFSKMSGSDNPNLFNNFNTFNFEEVRALAAQVTGKPELYQPKPDGVWDTDQRTKEKSKSLYVQLNTDWETAMPQHTSLGVRYEKTDVTSTAQVLGATGIFMSSANELGLVQGGKTFTTLTGEYHNLLPSLDYDIDLRQDLKLRASYGETIGRPRWDQIQGGQVLNPGLRVNGGTGSQGNPGLKPVKSKNFDLSLEWYYDKQSFAAVNFFKKNLEDYAGQTQIIATPFNLPMPVGGKYWVAAQNATNCGNDPVCIRDYIFRNFNGQPGVTRAPNDDTNGNATGTLVGQPGDPVAQFQITTYTNQKAASLNGLEFNVQHMFGNTGFGVQANYTYVHSGLKYDNSKVGEQFALIGLSNSANLVGIYEDSKWSVRAAYNWRGEFLNSTFDSVGPNPQYTEPYGQLDLSVSYNITSKLTVSLEGINVTDEVSRSHGRNSHMVDYMTQTGPRWSAGLRYKF